MTLWNVVMDSLESVERDLAPESQEVFEEVYDLVYMGVAGSVGPEDHKVGLIGENELRKRLYGIQLVSASR